MRRSAGLMMLGGLAAVVVSSSAQGQAKPYVFLGGGASIPTGHFKSSDGAKTGWIATGGIGADVGKKGLWIEAEGYYGSNKHTAPPAGDKTNIIVGIAALGYSFAPDKKATPYVTAGVGALVHQFRSSSVPADNGSETKFAYTGALGLVVQLGPKASFWVEGRLLATKAAKVVPIQAGFTIHFK